MRLEEIEPPACHVSGSSSQWDVIAGALETRAAHLRRLGDDEPLAARYDDVVESIQRLDDDTVPLYLSDLALARDAVRWFQYEAVDAGDIDAWLRRRELEFDLWRLEYEFATRGGQLAD